jgi:hypothetical protein
MASKNLTFDPNAGVPYAANLALYTGADFKATFNVVDISMGSTATRSLSEGRYEYNVLVSSGATIYNIVNGNILVHTGIASAPS